MFINTPRGRSVAWPKVNRVYLGCFGATITKRLGRLNRGSNPRGPISFILKKCLRKDLEQDTEEKLRISLARLKNSSAQNTSAQSVTKME